MNIIKVIDHDEQDKENFVVDSISKADWCVEKIANARLAIEKNNKYIEDMIKAYKEKLIDMNHDHEKTIENMLYLLREFAEQEVSKTKKKSFKTAFGTIGFRKGGLKRIIIDESKLLSWCKSNCADAIKVTEKPLISKIPKDIVPHGIKLEESENKLYVEPDETMINLKREGSIE